MRTLAVAAVLVGVLGFAGTAHAQFQNHSIGFELGYLHLDPTMQFKDAALPPALAVDATIYMEAGFDVGLRFGFAIQQDPNSTQIVVLYPAAMLRYFIWQDFFRPYVGVNLEFMHAFDGGGVDSGDVASDNYVGLGPTAGFEYFFAEEWSIGLNGEFAGYFALNAGAHYTAQIWARVATHF